MVFDVSFIFLQLKQAWLLVGLQPIPFTSYRCYKLRLMRCLVSFIARKQTILQLIRTFWRLLMLITRATLARLPCLASSTWCYRRSWMRQLMRWQDCPWVRWLPSTKDQTWLPWLRSPCLPRFDHWRLSKRRYDFFCMAVLLRLIYSLSYCTDGWVQRSIAVGYAHFASFGPSLR